MVAVWGAQKGISPAPSVKRDSLHVAQSLSKSDNRNAMTPLSPCHEQATINTHALQGCVLSVAVALARAPKFGGGLAQQCPSLTLFLGLERCAGGSPHPLPQGGTPAPTGPNGPERPWIASGRPLPRSTTLCGPPEANGAALGHRSTGTARRTPYCLFGPILGRSGRNCCIDDARSTTDDGCILD